jgi:alkylhydroperoxidase/carboxymuconolactone decarboxylase family protein YurZ
VELEPPGPEVFTAPEQAAAVISAPRGSVAYKRRSMIQFAMEVSLERDDEGRVAPHFRSACRRHPRGCSDGMDSVGVAVS